MTLTQLALSASMFHAFWLVNPYKIQRDRPSFSTNPRLRTNSPACAETCALDSYTVRKWHGPNLLNCTKNTENFGFYRHDNFFYQFWKKGTRPKDDWNNFLSRPYQNLLVSDDRTSAKVRPCAVLWITSQCCCIFNIRGQWKLVDHNGTLNQQQSCVSMVFFRAHLESLFIIQLVKIGRVLW